MFNTLPPLIQDWISNLNNKSTPKHIRYNYYTMLKNIVEEANKEIAKFQLELDR